MHRRLLALSILLAGCAAPDTVEGSTTVVDTTSTTKAGATTTTSPAPTSTAVPSGVAVWPGESIQNAVNANPAGTTFIIKAGVHANQSVAPKDGNRFIGESGAVLDGGNSTRHAFRPTANNVRIEGLEIRNYNNPAQEGAIQAGGHTLSEATTGWVVVRNNIHHNAGTGVRLGSQMLLDSNDIHHNRQLGVGGVSDRTTVSNNVISHNNYQQAYDPGWEAGGTKFALSTNLVVKNNKVHNNHGPGLWTDGSNSAVVYEGNHVYDNWGVGIFHEISFSAVIRNNRVERNGHGSPGWAYGAGILVAHSRDVEVYGNTLVDNADGIVGIEQNRGAQHKLRNLWVHDNTITFSSNYSGDGWSGVAQDQGDNTVFQPSANNRFDRNVYRICDGRTRHFEWNNAQRTWEEWRGFGQDANGRRESC